MEYTGDGLSWFVPGIYNSIAASYLASLLLLFTYRAGHFERRDVFHVLAAALELDAGLFAFAFFGDLDFELAFFAAEHVARGGGVGIGVTHGGSPKSWTSRTAWRTGNRKLLCTRHAEVMAVRNSFSETCRPSRTISKEIAVSGQPKQVSRRSN